VKIDQIDYSGPNEPNTITCDLSLSLSLSLSDFNFKGVLLRCTIEKKIIEILLSVEFSSFYVVYTGLCARTLLHVVPALP
jgi:hypothetical protein